MAALALLVVVYFQHLEGVKVADTDYIDGLTGTVMFIVPWFMLMLIASHFSRLDLNELIPPYAIGILLVLIGYVYFRQLSEIQKRTYLRRYFALLSLTIWVILGATTDWRFGAH